jgi:hypothetical protein
MDRFLESAVSACVVSACLVMGWSAAMVSSDTYETRLSHEKKTANGFCSAKVWRRDGITPQKTKKESLRMAALNLPWLRWLTPEHEGEQTRSEKAGHAHPERHDETVYGDFPAEKEPEEMRKGNDRKYDNRERRKGFGNVLPPFLMLHAADSAKPFALLNYLSQKGT